MPVCGDFVATAILLAVVIPVPTKGLVAKMSGFSGAERVGAGGAESQQEPTRQPRAADDVLENLRRQWFLPSGSLIAAQFDAEQPAMHAADGVALAMAGLPIRQRRWRPARPTWRAELAPLHRA